MQYLTVAKIINTHGIKGEVKVLCNYYGSNYNNWKVNETVYLKDNDNYQALTINTIRSHKNWLLISFKDYQNINLVLFMKSRELAVLVDQINEGNSFSEYQDLVGYQAINNQDHSILGQVVSLIDNNHTGLWEVVDQSGKNHYVPNDKFFISKIDKEKKMVYFNLISGMFNYE